MEKKFTMENDVGIEVNYTVLAQLGGVFDIYKLYAFG